MRGRFIVCEGTDGSGKATQAKLLAERLKENGIPVLYMDFPRYSESFFGRKAGQFLKGEFGGIKDVHPFLASLPFAFDRWQAGQQIDEMLESGGWVIASRYTLSNLAHQTAKLPHEEREEFVSQIIKMEYEVLGIPVEDHNFFLYVPTDISQALVDAKGHRDYIGNGRDIHEADLGHQQSAAQMYKYLARRFEHITTINCCNDKGDLMGIEEIHRAVWEHTIKLFGSELVEGGIHKERN